MAESNSKETCSSCLFFTGSGHLGTCRRYPPTTNKSPNEWCGEHIKLIHKPIEPVEPAPVESIPWSNAYPEGALEFYQQVKKRGRPAKK